MSSSREQQNAGSALPPSPHVTDPRGDARYRLLAETIPNHAWMVDRNGRFEYVNQRAVEYYGMDAEEINRRGWLALIAPDDHDTATAVWTEALSTGLGFEVECRRRRHDGSYRWFLTRGVPMPSDKGDSTCWIGTCTDIHDQKMTIQARAFIDELSERLRAASSPDEVLTEVTTRVGTYLRVSRCSLSENNWDTREVNVHEEYCAPGIQSNVGSYPQSAFSPVTWGQLKAGITVINNDVDTDPRTAAHVDFYHKLGLRAYIMTPIIRNRMHVAIFGVVMNEPREWTKDEILIVQTVAERTWMAVESGRLYRLKQQADAKQRAFVRDVLSVVTDGRLNVCESDADLPERLPAQGATIDLAEADGLRRLRHAARDIALHLGFDEGRSCDLMTAVSEAAMNAIVHAKGGQGSVCTDGSGIIQIWVIDQGAGISMENLPRATLVRGYSTASTLGHGFKMIISSTDRIYLLTTASGTTVVIEQLRQPPEPIW